MRSNSNSFVRIKENPDIVNNEKLIMSKLIKHVYTDNKTPVVFRKLYMKYAADGAITERNKLLAWVEIKARDCESTAFTNFKISYLKIVNLHKLSEENRPFKKVLIVVAFKDGIFYTDITNKKFEPVWWGMKNPENSEFAAAIEMSDFKYVCPSPKGYYIGANDDEEIEE